MHWNRIAIATILLGFVLFAGGVFWAKQDKPTADLLLELSSRFRPNRARIVIRFDIPERMTAAAVRDSSIHSSKADAATLAAMIGSKGMMTRLLESLSHHERIKVLGDHYWDRGESDFGGLQVTPDEHFRNRIVITAKHRDPMVAKLIATKLYETFRTFQLEKAKSNLKFVVSYLEQRVKELRVARDLNQEAMDAARQSNDETKKKNAELHLCVSKSNVRAMEKRLAEVLENPPLRTDPEIEVVSATIEYPALAFRPLTDFSHEFSKPIPRKSGRAKDVSIGRDS